LEDNNKIKLASVSIFILVVMIGGIWSIILFSGSVSSGPIPRQMKAIVKELFISAILLAGFLIAMELIFFRGFFL
jgi:hypothetical protein